MTNGDNLKISFHGGVAEKHLLPAYAGFKSMSDIALAMTRVMHFCITEKVRFKAPYDPGATLDISANPKAGSIEFLLDAMGPFVGEVANEAFRKFTIEYMEYIFRKALGRNDNNPKPESANYRDGDESALIDATVDPLIRVHQPIVKDNITNINIHNIEKGSTVIFNQDTYDYLVDHEWDAELYENLSTVYRYSGHYKEGTMLLYDFGRTFQFKLAPEADSETVDALNWSNSEQSRNRDGKIYIYHYRNKKPNGDIAKIKVIKARLASL